MNRELFVPGLFLVGGFVIFAAAVSLPERGGIGRRVWSVPHEEAGRNPRLWRWANALFVAAAVLSTVGVALLALSLAASPILAPVAALLYLLGNLLWIIFSLYRGTVILWAADHFQAKGEPPATYEPLSAWAEALASAYLVLGYVGIAALGGALLESGLLPGWIGWLALLWGSVLVTVMIVGRPRPTGQAGTIAHIPAWVQIPFCIVGLALLLTP